MWSEARRQKHREYLRKYYAENPEYRKAHIARVLINKAAHRQKVGALVTTFRRNGCVFCGEKLECCLAAHHLDPAKKDFTIGEARNKSKNLDVIKEELQKCVCLCFNCHAKVHAGLLSLPSSPM